MALTDAISVACKALGVAADVYWNMDATKYDGHNQSEHQGSQQPNVFSGKQLQEAIDEVRACRSRAEVNAVWKNMLPCRTTLSSRMRFK